MRHGPMVHRRANTSRLTHGATAPLAGLHSIRGLGGLQSLRDHRARSASAEVFESPRLNLMGMLPINLRRFLADHLGPMLRIEGDSILALDPQSGDRAIRELARAIRRFSAERARELWRECAIKVSRLSSELRRMPAVERHVVLCLRCAWIGVGADAASRHCEKSCLAIELNRVLECGIQGLADAAQALVPDGLRQAVEDFRMRRSAGGLPHFDLDCYLSNDQMIFTWRPLPSPAAPEQVVPGAEPLVSDASRVGAPTGRAVE